MENHKYKVNDLVTIKTRDWYDLHKDIRGNVLVRTLKGPERAYFTPSMSKYCGKVARILSTRIGDNGCGYYYSIDLDSGEFLWMDEMFIEDDNNQKKLNPGYDDVWKIGNLFAIVNTTDKLIFPDFFTTKKEAKEKLWKFTE